MFKLYLKRLSLPAAYLCLMGFSTEVCLASSGQQPICNMYVAYVGSVYHELIRTSLEVYVLGLTLFSCGAYIMKMFWYAYHNRLI